MSMDKVKLSPEAKRDVFRLLVRASLARHQARSLEALGTEMGFDVAAQYRAENRHLLVMARLRVEHDLFAQLKVRTAETLARLERRFPQYFQSVKVARNAPVKVSATPAFRRLQVLCVLGGDGLLPARAMAPGHNLPRLQAPWAAPECERSMALRTPNAMCQALTVPPS